MRKIIVVAAIVLAGCGSQSAPDQQATPTASAGSNVDVSTAAAAAVAAAPDLATCPTRDPVEEGLRQRTKPIAVPAALREVMRSDMDNFAVSTLDGTTACVDASWMESIRDFALSADKRFASFSWDGYEAYGHIIVDRSGKGIAIDTGTPPVASPSGGLLASADLTEFGFGALNAFAVWQVAPGGLRQVAKQEDLSQAQATDWRVDGWAGEACVDLSAIAWEDTTGATDEDPRKRYHARARDAWHIEPGGCARS